MILHSVAERRCDLMLLADERGERVVEEDNVAVAEEHVVPCLQHTHQ